MMRRILVLSSVAAILTSFSVYAANTYGVGATSGPVFTDSSAPNDSGSITQLLNELVKDTSSLDQDVKNNSSILVSQWNMQQKAQAAAGAQLLPSGLPFLWESTGYQYTTNLQRLAQASQQQVSQAILPSQCAAGAQSSSACQQAMAISSANILLVPQTKSIISTDVSSTPSSNVTEGSVYGLPSNATADNSNAYATQAISQYLQSFPQSYVSNLLGSKDKVAIYTVARLMASNISNDNAPSINAQLQQAVMQPFSQQKTPKTGKTWFQSLSTASTPQLLRMVAVQLAIRNYLAYQQYRLAQSHQLLTLDNTSKLVQLNNAINSLKAANNNNTNQVTTAIYQLDRDVQKMKQN